MLRCRIRRKKRGWSLDPKAYAPRNPLVVGSEQYAFASFFLRGVSRWTAERSNSAIFAFGGSDTFLEKGDA
jgi:hypothetical protein